MRGRLPRSPPKRELEQALRKQRRAAKAALKPEAGFEMSLWLRASTPLKTPGYSPRRMNVEIKETPIGGKVEPFLDVVNYIYRDDPNFVRPVDMDLKQRLSKKTTLFDHADGTLFTAHRNGYCVGRVSATIDREHIRLHQDGAGFFGFLDTIDDEEVATSLLEAAAGWLRARGMQRMRGPISMSINEELGCLVEGFDTPPMISDAAPPAIPRRAHREGWPRKAQRFLRLALRRRRRARRAQKAHDELDALPEVKSRHIDMKNLRPRLARVVMDVFNDAWSENWSVRPVHGSRAREDGRRTRLEVA